MTNLVLILFFDRQTSEMNKYFFSATVTIALIITALATSSFMESEESTEQTPSINWMTIQEIEAAQKEAPKPVLVDLYTSWCVWCSKMKESTYTDPGLVQYINQNFYATRFDAEADVNVVLKEQEYPLITINNRKVHKLAWEWGAKNNRIGYPTIVVLDNNLDKLEAFPGFKDADAMNSLVKYYGEGIYKSKSWQDYLSGGH